MDPRSVPVAYMFKPDHPAEQIQLFIQLCQKNQWPMRYRHNPESNLMLLVVLCEDTGTALYNAVNDAGIKYESIGMPSVQEIGAAKTIPLDWDVDLRFDRELERLTVVVEQEGQFLIFSPEGAHLW